MTKRTTRHWNTGLAFTLLAVAGSAALAQQGVQSRAAAPIGGGSFGVPSQPARMISPGGQGGIPLYRTNTLLPPDAAQFRPRPVGPTGPGGPMVAPRPGITNNLVKPIFGPGPTADGGTPMGTGGGYYYNPGAVGGSPGGGGGTTLPANPSWWGNNCNTGTSVNGSYHGDKWNLRFHLGSGGIDCNRPCYPSLNCYRYPLSWYYNNYWGGYGSYSQVVYSGPWYGTDPFVTQGQTSATQQAQTQAAAQERDLTPVEKAEVAWRAGQTSESVRWFREHLEKEPTDADAMRYLAMVLIDDRKVEQGVALMAMAYEKNPKLASKALPMDVLPGASEGQRRRVNAISTYANRVKTGSAWLTLAVLIQSEGRDDVAAKIVDKAKSAGGNAAVLDELALSLKN